MRTQQWMWPGLASVRDMPLMPAVKSKNDLHWIRSLLRSNRKARALMIQGGAKVQQPSRMTRRAIENR
jgi:hypothetical protein